jgi:hypothetical protein
MRAPERRSCATRWTDGEEMLDLDAVLAVCKRAGIVVPDPSVGIGRQLFFREASARTVAAYLGDSDVPEMIT